ncbi:hypothetical protein PHLGIDRAFT_12742 [Phlebiopsis gigantea 11061_1 CR5-6]|uniref:Uncharacterized protein n=1 Tax=Phlebiopsis gigantea (strain 11061_1 CR5-6) TaxID=745531 RepID=A0A0C3PN64_PHLG1|nr:hypothetical protein PHLGIDRAFT_12742 [Phlebiopsis gigantea 11061_1 CR5-6]
MWKGAGQILDEVACRLANGYTSEKFHVLEKGKGFIKENARIVVVAVLADKWTDRSTMFGWRLQSRPNLTIALRIRGVGDKKATYSAKACTSSLHAGWEPLRPDVGCHIPGQGDQFLGQHRQHVDYWILDTPIIATRRRKTRAFELASTPDASTPLHRFSGEGDLYCIDDGTAGMVVEYQPLQHKYD